MSKKQSLFVVFLATILGLSSSVKTNAQKWVEVTTFSNEGNRIDAIILNANQHNGKQFPHPNPRMSSTLHPPTLIVACDTGKLRVGVEFHARLFESFSTVGRRRGFERFSPNLRFGKEGQAKQGEWKSNDYRISSHYTNFLVIRTYEKSLSNEVRSKIYSYSGKFTYIETRNTDETLKKLRNSDELALSIFMKLNFPHTNLLYSPKSFIYEGIRRLVPDAVPM